MMRRAIAVPLLVLLTAVQAAGQLKSQGQAVSVREQLAHTPSPGTIMGFLGLDPMKFHMQHSYTLSVASFGGQTYTQGLYLNTMTYQFSPRLVAQLQLGMLHQPFGSPGTVPGGRNLFVSGARVLYRPFKNTTLHFQYVARPYPYPGLSPYSRDPYLDPMVEEEP
ncbi:MAG: hypothetical protein ONB23_01570 [candidate division KSB1 bacterium]|nr:hypothetical protein [candidate division KSB1 bacterium]